MDRPFLLHKNCSGRRPGGSRRKERSMKTYHPITGEILEQLRSIVGEKYVWTDPDHLE